jgi:hypothetical protein
VGSWGVRAHESDYGLDLLAAAEERYLRGVKYKTFHIKHVTELLRTHIINQFAKESVGWEAEYINFFYGYTLPYQFAHAVILVAECFAEYRQQGTYRIRDYKEDKNRRIAMFIYTGEVLNALLTEPQAVNAPEHPLYETWKDADTRNEWQTHSQTLCDGLSQAIGEGGDGDA